MIDPGEFYYIEISFKQGEKTWDHRKKNGSGTDSGKTPRNRKKN